MSAMMKKEKWQLFRAVKEASREITASFAEKGAIAQRAPMRDKL